METESGIKLLDILGIDNSDIPLSTFISPLLLIKAKSLYIMIVLSSIFLFLFQTK